MTIQEAENILGDRATWELQNMKKALSILTFFNTDDDNKRLEACKVILKSRKDKQ